MKPKRIGRKGNDSLPSKEDNWIIREKMKEMKTIVIYNSQTGFTKKYAEWIADAVHAECVKFSDVKKKDLTAYDAIVFGGWACAGSISKLGWFKSHIEEWAGKRLIAFCVGASPLETPDVAVAMKQIFTEEEHQKVSLFYCPGGLNYDIMPAPSKLMMKMFRQVCKAKKNKTDADREMIKMLGSSYDISDRKYIEPLIECLVRG